MHDYERLFENNRKWAERLAHQDPQVFERMASSQAPDCLFIGCSDSRIPANEIVGLAPGEMFVHRNVANLVNNVDLNVLSVLEYAVRHLKVKRIIVCGHTMCGGVRAAMQPVDMGFLNPWLRNIRDVYRLHKAELDSIKDESNRYDRLVELSVEEQCVNVLKTTVVQKFVLETGFPTVHGWVFDVRNGRIKDLDLDFKKIMATIRQIYDVTGQQPPASTQRQRTDAERESQLETL